MAGGFKLPSPTFNDIPPPAMRHFLELSNWALSFQILEPMKDSSHPNHDTYLWTICLVLLNPKWDEKRGEFPAAHWAGSHILTHSHNHSCAVSTKNPKGISCSFCPFRNPNRAGTAEQLVGWLPGTHEALGSVFTTTYTDVMWVAHASDPGVCGVKTGGSRV